MSLVMNFSLFFLGVHGDSWSCGLMFFSTLTYFSIISVPLSNFFSGTPVHRLILFTVPYIYFCLLFHAFIFLFFYFCFSVDISLHLLAYKSSSAAWSLILNPFIKFLNGVPEFLLLEFKFASFIYWFQFSFFIIDLF